MSEGFNENFSNDMTNSELYKLLMTARDQQTEELKTQINSKVLEINHTLEEANKKITNLEEKVSFLERKIRRNNIIIFGLEVNNPNLLAGTLKKLNALLNINITERDINNIYKAKTANPKPHIVVEFVSLLKKQKIFENIRNLKGSGVAIANDLSVEDREIQKVLLHHLKKARQQKLTAKIKGNKLEVDGVLYSVKDLAELESNSQETDESEEETEEDSTEQIDELSQTSVIKTLSSVGGETSSVLLKPPPSSSTKRKRAKIQYSPKKQEFGNRAPKTRQQKLNSITK